MAELELRPTKLEVAQLREETHARKYSEGASAETKSELGIENCYLGTVSGHGADGVSKAE